MNKFKVGDKITYVRVSGLRRVGIVVAISKNSGQFLADWANEDGSGLQRCSGIAVGVPCELYDDYILDKKLSELLFRSEYE